MKSTRGAGTLLAMWSRARTAFWRRGRDESGFAKFGLRTLLCLLLLAGTVAVPFVEATNARANTLQASADNGATGWYPNQSQLTPASVTSGNFGEIFDTQLNGPVYAQPIVSQPTVLAVTETNNAYGLNSTTGAITWHDNFGTPEQPIQNINCGDVGTNLGITGTPVVDPATNVAYFVAEKQEAGNTGQDFMEAVNVATGATPSNWPAGGVPIQGSADDDPSSVFNATFQTQRPGTGTRQWRRVRSLRFPVRLRRLERLARRGLGVNGVHHHHVGDRGEHDGHRALRTGAGIWQSSSPPVVDANGDIFVSTGNGFIPSGPEPGHRPRESKVCRGRHRTAYRLERRTGTGRLVHGGRRAPAQQPRR